MVEPGLKAIADQGLLGVILLLVLFGVWKMINLFRDEVFVNGKQLQRERDEKMEAQARAQHLHDLIEKAVAPDLERIADALERLDQTGGPPSRRRSR